MHWDPLGLSKSFKSARIVIPSHHLLRLPLLVHLQLFLFWGIKIATSRQPHTLSLVVWDPKWAPRTNNLNKTLINLPPFGLDIQILGWFTIVTEQNALVLFNTNPDTISYLMFSQYSNTFTIYHTWSDTSIFRCFFYLHFEPSTLRWTCCFVFPCHVYLINADLHSSQVSCYEMSQCVFLCCSFLSSCVYIFVELFGTHHHNKWMILTIIVSFVRFEAPCITCPVISTCPAHSVSGYMYNKPFWSCASVGSSNSSSLSYSIL